MKTNDCSECSGELIESNGFWVCSSCGLCLDGPVFESKKFNHNESNWQKENRKERSREIMEYRKRVYVYTSVFEEMQALLRGTGISYVRFCSEAVVRAIDQKKRELENGT